MTMKERLGASLTRDGKIIDAKVTWYIRLHGMFVTNYNS
jgi:hypothetical protein